jgi:predicted O-linked N-acetylglucosamine transferase (SPINDLY family)
MISAELEFRSALESFRRGDHADAERRLRAAAQAAPRHAGVLNLLGALLASQERYDQAEPFLRAATKIPPVSAATLYNHGLALQNLERPRDALAAFDKALAKDPRSADAWFGRGSVLQEEANANEAIACFDRALAIDPNYHRALANKGSALLRLRRFSESLLTLEACVRLNPKFAPAHLNRAAALYNLRRHGLALAAVDTATTLAPDVAEGWVTRANICRELGRLDEAIDSIGRALALEPSNRQSRDTLVDLRLRACDWSHYHSDFAALQADLRAGVAVSPALCLTFPFSSAEQFAAAETRARLAGAPQRAAGRRAPRQGRIRVAYLSAELRNHATGHLFVGAIERHDRSRFEVTILNDAPRDGSSEQKRVIDAIEAFVDVFQFDDAQLIDFIRQKEIDILVNLDFASERLRHGVLAAHPAPLQVNYLGSPGTAAAANCDYLIADRIVVPPEEERWFVEKIAYLPDSYQPNDSKREIGERAISRREAELPDGAFVFCSFNTNYKLNPDTFDVWTRVLVACPGSVLWLLQDTPVVVGNLKKAAAARGVDPSRLIFAKRTGAAQHLARNRLADLFLDGWPYGAHTTASDALWAGLPVLTRLGETFASRVASSLLMAVGLPELIAPDREAFAATAIDLAHDRERLQALKAKLAHNRATAPLFDTALYTRRLEAAFEAMQARRLANLPPDAIHIPA